MESKSKPSKSFDTLTVFTLEKTMSEFTKECTLIQIGIFLSNLTCLVSKKWYYT